VRLGDFLVAVPQCVEVEVGNGPADQKEDHGASEAHGNQGIEPQPYRAGVRSGRFSHELSRHRANQDREISILQWSNSLRKIYRGHKIVIPPFPRLQVLCPAQAPPFHSRFCAILAHIAKALDFLITKVLDAYEHVPGGAKPRLGFDLPFDVGNSGFQEGVWQELQEISAGETVSHAKIARRVRPPKAVRAVAEAAGRIGSLRPSLPSYREE
jgi:hypothetical protein